MQFGIVFGVGRLDGRDIFEIGNGRLMVLVMTCQDIFDLLREISWNMGFRMSIRTHVIFVPNSFRIKTEHERITQP